MVKKPRRKWPRKKHFLRNHASRLSSTSGQATTEYILIVFFIAVGVIALHQYLKRADVASRLTGNKSSLTQFQSAYKYGHPKAKGFDEGGPEYHPRFDSGGTNFRLFIRQGQ